MKYKIKTIDLMITYVERARDYPEYRDTLLDMLTQYIIFNTKNTDAIISVTECDHIIDALESQKWDLAIQILLAIKSECFT